MTNLVCTGARHEARKEGGGRREKECERSAAGFAPAGDRTYRRKSYRRRPQVRIALS